ncbi:MAG: phosphatase domain-containing protein [Ginsengibacter sp.]
MITYKEKKLSLFERLKKKILSRLHLTNDPVIKLYQGYGNPEKVIVFGHVLCLSSLPRKKYKKNFINNTYGLLRLFMVKRYVNVGLSLQWDGVTHETKTQDDGFFKFEWSPASSITPGWHPVKVRLLHPGVFVKPIEVIGEFFIPYEYKYAFISDIDDTFLISHSSNLRKRLYVLFTKNARSRKPFEGVVNHYQLLANTGASRNTHNLFFYVSSSEWNLYDYIFEFAKINKLPKGIYLLNQLKTFRQVFKTGQNNHKTKFMRISRILETYPDQKFILLGDDSQEDPNIYAAIVEHFPQNIYAVYLRHILKSNQERVAGIVEKMEATGVKCCYFTHSAEAVIHSKQIGLIAKN